MGERHTLVGRDAEVATLVQCLGAVADGYGTILVIEGEPGIGKTRLLAEASAAALAAGFTVLSGNGYELAQDYPFGAVAQALDLRSSSPDAQRAAIAVLLRSAPSQSQSLEFRLLEDIQSQVERLSIKAPVLLAMDDLQWVDSPSLLALAHLAQGLAPLRIAMICTVRPPPRRTPVDQFLWSGAAMTRLQLGPLSAAAVADLVAHLLKGEPGPRLLNHVAGGAGSPLLVRELAEALRQQGSLGRVGSAVELIGEPLPPSFRRLVLDRLRSVPPETANVLRIASVLGSAFSVADLAATVHRTATDLTEVLEPALRQGLLGELDEHLAFRHQLVRDVIYEDMPRSVRSALHSQVGHVLAGLTASAARVAMHLAKGSEGDRAEAVDWLRRAASEAAYQSPQLAVDLLDRAVSLAGGVHPAREEMLVDRALALTWAGRADETVLMARAMLTANAGSPLEERMRLALAQALLVQGRWAESAEELEALASRTGVAENGRGRLLGDAALARAHSGDLRRATALAHEARAVGERLRDALTQSIAMSSLAVVAHFEARYLESLDASREALMLEHKSDNPEAGLRPTSIWLGLGLADADQFEEALQVLQVGRRHCEVSGRYWQLPLYQDGIATIHFYAGEWDDAVAEMETCVVLAQERGTLWWVVPANCILAYIAIHRDQDDVADAALSAANRQLTNSTRDFGANRLMWVTGLRHEARGDLKQALSQLVAGWEATTRAGFLPHYLTIGPDLVRVALSAGDRGRAHNVAETVDAVAARTGVRSAAAIGLRCLGLVQDDAALLLEAVTALRVSPRRVDLALACEDAGTHLVREGNTASAVPLLDEALAEYRRIGARRDAGRTVSALRAAGVRRPPPDRSPRPSLGWQALTLTEQRVMELASQGLTNPEIGNRLFISRRTVATHLSHIFGKLQISSRVELAALARDRRNNGSLST
jgi:DNA-binding CsgD family transcriptional regulator